jgi:hypothetical protein
MRRDGIGLPVPLDDGAFFLDIILHADNSPI